MYFVHCKAIRVLMFQAFLRKSYSVALQSIYNGQTTLSSHSGVIHVNPLCSRNLHSCWCSDREIWVSQLWISLFFKLHVHVPVHVLVESPKILPKWWHLHYRYRFRSLVSHSFTFTSAITNSLDSLDDRALTCWFSCLHVFQMTKFRNTCTSKVIFLEEAATCTC